MNKILLIVDDDADVARSLQRLLSKSFDAVLVALTPEVAERLLGDPDRPPTHLVCDHFLGKGKRFGADLIPQWRRSYPLLRVAVLLTGSEVPRQTHREGIDSVMWKPADIAELRRCLLEKE